MPAVRFRVVRDWLGRRTSTQLAGALAVLAAVALSGSILVTGLAVRMDQREQAALAALADYAAMVSKLGTDESLNAESLTTADAAYLSAWLSAFQSGPTRDRGTIEQTCRSGSGGAGIRFIRPPDGKPVGLAWLGHNAGERAPRLGPDIYVVKLPQGALCSIRSVDAVVVRRQVGALEIVVGRTVKSSGEAFGWSVLVVLVTGLVILVSGLAAAHFARRRLIQAIAGVSQTLDRAAVGDFSTRAPEVDVAPELTELTAQVNRTLDRLEELLSWMRDSADQLAHDFRTPLARAAARLDKLREGHNEDALEVAAQARDDIRALARAMNEAMALRDGEAWSFETVRLDRLAHQAAELYQPLAEDRGVEIVVEAEAASVLGVRSLLQRAVTNLVDNAIKYSPDGGVVTLGVGPGADGQGSWFSVADQGPGLDPATMKARDVPDEPEIERESHGMGLRFVRAILRRHAATMTISDGAPGAVVTARFTR